MADNTTINVGTGGDVISTDDIAGVKVQRVKVQYGVDGSATDVSSTNGLPIQGITAAASSTAWTSATAVNTANSITIAGMNAVSVTLIPTSTFTAGVITFEVSPDNINWVPVSMARIDTFTTESTYTIAASTNRGWTTSVDGFNNFRVRLSTAITGTGTATVIIIPQAFAIEPMVTVGQSAASQLNMTVGGTTASADGVPNPTTSSVLAMQHIYNSNVSNWERPRTASSANATTGTGVPASGIMGFDGTNYRRLVTDTAGNIIIGTGTNTIGAFNLNTRATGGSTPFTLISAATTNATSIKATAGVVYSIQASNTGASVAFLKLYNLATAPTVGTSVAVMTLIIPAGGGITVPIPPQGINFATGIAMAVTAAATTADTTAVALAQVVANIQYA